LEKNETGETHEPIERRKQALGRAVFHLIRDGDLLDKLNRYEVQLINQLARVSAELEHQRLQRSAPLEFPRTTGQ
jgi:hypothetical protein